LVFPSYYWVKKERKERREIEKGKSEETIDKLQ
jgi:hypothetical protein